MGKPVLFSLKASHYSRIAQALCLFCLHQLVQRTNRNQEFAIFSEKLSIVETGERRLKYSLLPLFSRLSISNVFDRVSTAHKLKESAQALAAHSITMFRSWCFRDFVRHMSERKRERKIFVERKFAGGKRWQLEKEVFCCCHRYATMEISCHLFWEQKKRKTAAKTQSSRYTWWTVATNETIDESLMSCQMECANGTDRYTKIEEEIIGFEVKKKVFAHRTLQETNDSKSKQTEKWTIFFCECRRCIRFTTTDIPLLLFSTSTTLPIVSRCHWRADENPL